MKPKVQNKIKYSTSIFGTGSILAAEDAVLMQKYSKSVKCLSQKGILLTWELSNFLQIKFNNLDTWKMLTEKSQSKLAYENNISHLTKEMKYPEKLKGDNKGIPEYSIIKPNDFFAQSFEGMQIPKNKINRVINRIV